MNSTHTTNEFAYAPTSEAEGSPSEGKDSQGFASFIQSIREASTDVKNKEIDTLYKSEINNKISGYRSQDILKKLYNKDSFVDFPFVLSALIESNLDCFYCRKKVSIVYNNVREPMQWSLERIDNSMGHNKDNVEIACLSCNLRRRTIYHERFIFTKQLNLVKLGCPTINGGPIGLTNGPKNV